MHIDRMDENVLQHDRQFGGGETPVRDVEGRKLRHNSF
jgi:hypothetical protein